MFLPFIQYHEIGENSAKSLDLSMLLNDTANGRKKKNCKFRLCFCKSVQTFYAKVACPTFWDRPPELFSFSHLCRQPFSLTTAMQILNIDYVPSFENELNIPYLVFIRLSFSRKGCASIIKKTILDTAQIAINDKLDATFTR